MPAHNDVHLRLVEHVPHVQAAGHVRRRQKQGEHRARRLLGGGVGGVFTEKSFSLTQYSAQRASIAPGSYDLGNSCGMSKYYEICVGKATPPASPRTSPGCPDEAPPGGFRSRRRSF